MFSDTPEDLVIVYRLLRTHGLNDAHSGNASVRIGDMIWITPTGACADSLRVDELVALALDANAVAARDAGASADTPLHLAVYRENPATRAVLHSHAAHAVALSLDGEDFRPPDLEGQLYFGESVPVLNVGYDEHFTEAPAQVGRALARCRAIIARGHGIYAAGESLNLAYKWTGSLALSAKTAWIYHQHKK